MLDLTIKKKFIKILSIVSIVCVAVSGLIGISLITGILGASGTIGQIALSLLTVFVACIFLFNAVEAISRKNILGYITAIMILTSAVLFLVWIWISDSGDFYGKIVIIISLVSVFFDIVTGNYIILRGKLLAVQIVSYALLFYIELTIALLVWGNTTLIELWQVFAIVIIAFLVLFAVLRVKIKGEKSGNGIEVSLGKPKGKFVTAKEYEELKKENERLKELLRANKIEF